MRYGAWLRITHCYIFSIVTIPLQKQGPTHLSEMMWLVAEALGTPRTV